MILDYQSNAQIVLNTTNPPMNNIHALSVCLSGIHSLAHTVREEEIRKISSSQDIVCLQIMGDDTSFLVKNAFSWFSVTLNNYLRLIALIDIMQRNNWKSIDLTDKNNKDSINKHCRTYVESVAPEIYKWRNKVSAHFSATDPFDKDNEATLEYSIMDSVGDFLTLTIKLVYLHG